MLQPILEQIVRKTPHIPFLCGTQGNYIHDSVYKIRIQGQSSLKYFYKSRIKVQKYVLLKVDSVLQIHIQKFQVIQFFDWNEYELIDLSQKLEKEYEEVLFLEYWYLEYENEPKSSEVVKIPSNFDSLVPKYLKFVGDNN